MRSWSRLVPVAAGLFTLVNSSKWDKGFDAHLDGDSPIPRPTPLDNDNLYPYLSPGSVPIEPPHGDSKDALQQWSGRLDYKRDAQCADPTYSLVCPITENLPCCPPGYTICCHDPSDKCCKPGYFCVGTTGCCQDGTTACGDGCCASGTTCCGGTRCCSSGYVCSSDNVCINPQLSSQSVASVQSMASLASIGSISFASVASLSSEQAVTLSQISLQSVSSELAAQTRDGSNPDTINTANVLPSDPRIVYNPPDAWSNTASNSGVGSCNNGTKVTQRLNSNFTFIFEGTDISLYIIPASNGGTVSIQIDGQTASSYSANGNYGGQCVPAQAFVKNNMPEGAHELTVQNSAGSFGSSAGTLEFNSIVYTGKGAFGTAGQPTGKKSNAAVIGGSVGGVLGAVALVGGGILFWLYRKRQQNNANGAGVTGAGGMPATPNQPMLFQPNPTGPYSPGTQPSNLNTPGSPSSQAMGQSYLGAGAGYAPSAYSGMQQPPTAQPGQGWGAQGSSSPPMTNIAPLPMWVERARRDDATSMTPSDPASLPPGAQPAGPNPLYGSYHPDNTHGWR